MSRLFLVLCSFLLALGVASAEPCPPAAILTGDTAEASAVSALLLARGVSLAASAGCPSTKVRIIRVEKQLLLEIEDSLGRSSRRLVSTYEAAATVIESWVYDATDAVLFDDLFPREPARPAALELSLDDTPAAATQPEEALAVPALPEAPPVLALSSWRGVEASVLTELAVTGGGSLWFGVAAKASKRFGPLQVSLLARYLRKSPLELSSDDAAAKASPVSSEECTPQDPDNDGITNFLDCGAGCILLDVDLDGSLDDKQCQGEEVACVTLDLNNDGEIDDFQCQQLPECTTEACGGLVPFSLLRSGYGLQAEVGLPFAVKGSTLTPSIALGLNQLFAPNLEATRPLLHAETFVSFSRQLTKKLRLDSRLSLSVTPNMPTSEGQSTARLSLGLGWLK